MRILARVVVNAFALWVTSYLPGPPYITFRGSLATLLLAGAIFGLFNLLVRPIAIFLAIPALLLTLGLFYLILNGILLWLASFVLPGYEVHGILAGILGSLVIGVVNWALHALVASDRRG